MQGQKQIQELKQSLKLTPQQMQFVRLLEFNTLEFEQYVGQELVDNPALEEGADSLDLMEREEDELSSEDFEDPYAMTDYLTEDDYEDMPSSDKAELTAFVSAGPAQPSTPSLQEYLNEQLMERDLSEEEQMICQYIIGNLTDDGCLDRSLEAISDDLLFQVSLEVSVSDLEQLLKIIQQFDPPGVAARNLQECLWLQLQHMDESDERNTALQIVQEQFENYSHKNFAKLLGALKISEEQFAQANRLITHLNPRPGAAWSDDGVSQTAYEITPDFIVEGDEGHLTLSLNMGNSPELRITPSYHQLLQATSAKSKNPTREAREAAQYVKQKIDAARWFIDAVKQRQQTLRSVMEAIIQLQRAYFLSGDESSLRPMILKDVAELTGYDISTVSRVTNSKYVQTSFGIFSLKHFFSEGFVNEEGEEITTRQIKLTLKSLIEGEDKQDPYNDDVLAELLKAKGYQIARRTVAKYREQLNIPSSRFRRELGRT
jgi:RNA polymerase sigma-54 factor